MPSAVSLRSFVPKASGALAAAVVFLALCPQAHASPLVMAVDVGTEVLGLFDAVARAVVHGGSVCVHGLRSVGAAFGIDVHAGPNAAACHDLRGVGFVFLGLAAVVVIAVGRMRLATEQRRLDVARRLIERGFEPPAGLLTGPAARDLRKGVVLVFAGLGLVVAGMMLGDRGVAAGGLIPAFIGIGYLVSHRLAAPDEPDGAGPPEGSER